MLPVNVPPSVPVPVPGLRLKVMAVEAATLRGVPPGSCASTVTEKPVPTLGVVPPLIDVITSFVGKTSSLRIVP